MSNSVVPAAAVAHAKQLVRNKNLSKHSGNQQHAPDEQNAADHNAANDHHQFDATNVVQIDQPDHVDAAHLSMAMPMGDVAMGNSVFTDALAGAAVSEAALTTSYAAASAQDDGGSASDDGAGGPGGTVLLVGAVGLAGLGVAVLASGGDNNNDGGNNGGPENQAPTFSSGATASVDENADLATVLYDANASDPDGDTLTYSLSGADKDLFNIDAATGVVTQKAFLDVDAATEYHFTVSASDGELSTDQAVTLTINPVEQTFQDQEIDGTGIGQAAEEFDASTGAFNFTDDADIDTNVVISGFGADDKITVSNATADDYGFGTGDDPNDLEISFNNGEGVANLIVLDDVLTGYDGLVVDAASAQNALASLFDVQDSNFFNFA